MHLARIELTNFKNYEEVSLDFSPGFNCFVGNNGVGKTNILDAVHYLSLTKSFFNNSDTLSIRYGEDYFILKGMFEKDGSQDERGVDWSLIDEKQGPQGAKTKQEPIFGLMTKE